MADKGKIQYGIGIDNSELLRDAERAKDAFKGIADKAEKDGGRIDNTFKNLAKGAAAFFTIQQASQLVQGLIKVRGEFQQLEIAFGTMLGNKAKADKLMSEMVALAAKTPFGLQDVASGAKQLLAYGFAADSITDNIKMLGNVASGVGSQVGDLIYLYGTLKASGRVTQMDINQFAGRGIPIYSELAKVMNTNVEAVRDLVGAGQVGFTQIEKAFKNMTGEGGMFFNLMEAQSASLTGHIANLQDSIQMMFNEIGQSGEGLFSDAISGASYLVEHYQEIGKTLQVLVTTYGVYRAALILTSVAQATKIAGSKALVVAELSAALSGKAVTAGMVLQAGATNLATAAQAKLNKMFMANPVGLVITAVASLAATMYYFHDSSTAAERAQKKFNEALDENKQKVDDIKTKTQELASIINDDTQTKSAQIMAFRQLQELYGDRLKDLSLEEFQLKTNTEQQKRFNAELQNIGLDDLKKQFQEATVAAQALSTITIALGDGTTSTQDNTMSKEYQAATDYAEQLRGKIEDIELTEKLAAMTAQELTKYYQDQLPPLQRQIDEWERTHGKIKRASDGSLILQRTWDSFQINGAINQWNTLLGIVSRVNQASGGAAISPTTPQQYKDRAQKAKEDAANEADPKKRAELLKQAAKDEKTYRYMMGETDRAAAKSAASASQKAENKAASEAKRKAEELKRERERFHEHLADQKKDFDDTVRLSAFEGVDREVEQIKINYEKAIEKAKDLKIFTEEMAKELNIRQQTEIDFARGQDAKEKAKKDEEDRIEAESKHLADLLAKYATYEQQKKVLREQYEKDITKLSPEQQAERKRQYDEDIANLDEAEAKKLISVKKYADEAIYTTKLAVRQQLEILNAAYNQAGLTPETKAALKSRIDEVAKLLSLSDSELTSAQIDAEINKKQAAINELAKAGKQGTDEFKRLNDELMRLKQEKLNYLTDRIDTFRALSSAVGQLGNALSSLGDSSPALASIGNALQSVSSSADLFLTNWEKLANGTLKSSDKIQMASTFIINALNNILQSVQQNKLKEAEALQNVIDFQRGYNLALIEEQKIRDEMANNVFYKDNMRTIRANLSKQISLVKEYDKAMKDLEEGQVKVGTKKAKRDWASVGASTAAGAGTGAVIGASGGVLSIPGAIIGGAVGFITGMLKKRQVVDVYDNLLKKYPLLIDAEGNLNDAMAKSLLSSNLLDAKTKETLQYVSNLAEEYKKAKAEIDEVVKSLIGDVGNNVMSALVDNYRNGGEDAGDAFRKGFAKSLERLYEDIIYAAIFGKDLEKMQKRIEDGFNAGDMGIMETAMYEFLDGYEQKSQATNDLMKRMQDYAKSKGIDIWQGDTSAANKPTKNTLSGAFAQASQESIDLLSGQTMAFKIAQLETNGHLVQMKDYAFRGLDYAERTANNTANTVARLDTIISKMNNNANNALAAGL